MKRFKVVAILVLALGIGLPAGRASGQIDYGPIDQLPSVKGQSSFTFLTIGLSPRAAAMGEAFSAMMADVNAIFYNPAALGFIEKGQYSISYTNWLAGSNLFSGAAVHRAFGGVWGFSMVSARPEAVEETTIFESLGTGRMIRGGNLAVGVAFARQMTDKVSWGIQAKYIREDLVLATTSTWQFDLGITAHTGYRSFRIAAAARNVGGETTAETRPFSPPIYFNFGVAGEIVGNEGDPAYLTVATETLFATDYGQRWHFGGELWLNNAIALRAGYKSNYEIENYGLGVGVKQGIGDGEIRIDVSYNEGGEDFSAPLRMAIGGSF